MCKIFNKKEDKLDQQSYIKYSRNIYKKYIYSKK